MELSKSPYQKIQRNSDFKALYQPELTKRHDFIKKPHNNFVYT